MRIFGLYLLVILLFSSAAQAREEFWYLGAGGGATFLEDKDELFTSIDEKSTTAKAYVGYRVSTYIALEVDYAYYGEYDYQGLLGNTATPGTSGSAEYSALSASIVVMYPLIWDGFELFTPVGVSLVDTQTDIKNKTTGGYKLGFGLAYTPSFSKHFTMRTGAEVLVFDLEGEDEDFKQNLASVYMTLQYNF